MPRNDGARSFSREGAVGGLRAAALQGHLAADLAAAAAGAGEGASHQLPEPQPKLPVQPLRQPVSGGTGQNKTQRH